MEALLGTSRLLTAVVARSLARIDATVTTPQLRVLVLLGTRGRGAVNLSMVAQGLGVNPSNASRTCEQLVVAGLVSRREDPTDRRQVALGLTDSGEALVRASMDHRRAVFTRLVDAMPSNRRAELAAGLEGLLATTAELSEPHDPPSSPNPVAGEDAVADTEARETDRLLRWLL